MNDARLVIRNVDKSFAAPVLRGISMQVGCGEIHALVGENGAGKTTLVNILAGNLARDAGSIVLDGSDYLPANATDAFAAGVSCAAQEMSSIETLTVAENISLRSLPTRGIFIDRAQLRADAEKLMRYVGMSGNTPDTEAGDLSIADRQLLEIARALAVDCSLLILDEPTAALTAPQAERLHEILLELKERAVSVIYISHRLDDVLKVADVISVLRDGQVVASDAASRFTAETLLEQMTGQSRDITVESDRLARAGSTVLELERATSEDFPAPLSFSCASAEIVGIAGLAGSGRTELLNVLFGVVPTTGGRVLRQANGNTIEIRSAHQAVAAGMGFLGEDRQSMGIYSGQSILMNIAVPGEGNRAMPVSFIDSAREKTAAMRLAERLDIRYRKLHQDIDELSGGNQQKALLARWLLRDADILLLDEPTRGIDVATKFAIYDLLAQLSNSGKSIVIASSEIDELMFVCDRIEVISNRQLVSSFQRSEFSERDILAAAFSNYQSAEVSGQRATAATS